MSFTAASTAPPAPHSGADGPIRWVASNWNLNTAPATCYFGRWPSPSSGSGIWLRGRPALDLVGLVEAMTRLGLIAGFAAHPGQLEWPNGRGSVHCAATFSLQRPSRPDCLLVANPADIRRAQALPRRVLAHTGNHERPFDLVRVSVGQILPSLRTGLTPSRIARLDSDPSLHHLSQAVRRLSGVLLP